MICKYCNTENLDGVKFCFHCGKPLIPDEVPPMPNPNPDPVPNPDPDPVPIPEPDPVPKPDPDPEPDPESNVDPNSKKHLIIGVVAFLVVVIVGVIIATALNSNKYVPNDDSSSSSRADKESSKVSEKESDQSSEIETTKPELEYKNIIDNTGDLTGTEKKKLQSLLEDKSRSCGATVIIVADDDHGSSMKDYTEEIYDKYIDSKDGVVVLIDNKENDSLLRFGGKGWDLTPQSFVDVYCKEIDGHLRSNDLYEACYTAADLFPESVSEANLYDFERVSNADQVVYANSDDSTLTLIEWDGVKPKKLFSTNTVYFGSDGLTTSPSESKNATPIGTFELGFAMSVGSIDTGLDYKKISPNMVWVDDPDSSFYNELVTITNYTTVPPKENPGKWKSSELMYNIFEENGGDRNACILIEHNGDGNTRGESGKGSAIFLSGKTSDISESWGDVNISASSMEELLALLDERKNPHIVIS